MDILFFNQLGTSLASCCFCFGRTQLHLQTHFDGGLCKSGRWVGSPPKSSKSESGKPSALFIAATDASCTRMPHHRTTSDAAFPKTYQICDHQVFAATTVPKKGSQKGDGNKSGLTWCISTTKVANQGRNPDARPALTSSSREASDAAIGKVATRPQHGGLTG